MGLKARPKRYSEVLADRVRDAIGTGDASGVSAKEMFGGLCFLVNGNMACGIAKDELMVRVGKAGHADALSRPHARPMDFTGRPLRGMVYVAAAGIRTDAQLAAWVARGAIHARSLPAK